MIRKKGKKWCVLSPNNPDWSGGCYRTKKEAQARLKQVEKAKHARGMGQSGRLCWETEATGLTRDEAMRAMEESSGATRIKLEERGRGWSLEVKRPCGPAHPMRRFMYTGLGGRRKR